MNNFIHENNKIFTSNGIKSISKIKDKDLIAVVDEFGRVKYTEPIIEEDDEYGIYFVIKTDIADFFLSANSMMYYNGNMYQKMIVNDIANTLTGTTIKIPAIPNRQHDNRILRHINDTAIYYLSKLKRTHIKRGEWLRLKVCGKRGIEFMDELIDYHLLKSNIEWYAKNDRTSTKKFYWIKKVPRDNKKLDFKVVDALNYFQSKSMIYVSSLLDSIGSKTCPTSGKALLIEDFNSHTIPIMSIKGGFRCRLYNNYGFEDGYDSIVVGRRNVWDAKILSAYMAQNEIKDMRLILPEEYRGVVACADGHVFVLPTNKTI